MYKVAKDTPPYVFSFPICAQLGLLFSGALRGKLVLMRHKSLPNSGFPRAGEEFTRHSVLDLGEREFAISVSTLIRNHAHNYIHAGVHGHGSPSGSPRLKLKKKKIKATAVHSTSQASDTSRMSDDSNHDDEDDENDADDNCKLN